MKREYCIFCRTGIKDRRSDKCQDCRGRPVSFRGGVVMYKNVRVAAQAEGITPSGIRYRIGLEGEWAYGNDEDYLTYIGEVQEVDGGNNE